MSANPPPAPAKPGPIIHVRADSDSLFEDLFRVVLSPPGTQPPTQTPMTLRNLPQSFFNPPQTGGSRSPSRHSRENSVDSPNGRMRLSPMQQQQHLTPQPVHSRAHSSPANLQQTMAAAQQQQQQQQQQLHFHLRQPSFDVVQGMANMSGPLPSGWEEARTAEGAIYYINHITKSTQWEDPRIQHNLQLQQQQQQQLQLSEHQQQQQQQQQSQQHIINMGPLPPGWEEDVTPEGIPYFINHTTKTTTWFDPRLPANNQAVPVRNLGNLTAQQHQQQLRLQRLETERRMLQQRQAELDRLERARLMRHQQQQPEHQRTNSQDMIQVAQEMLIRHNINGDNNNMHQPPHIMPHHHQHPQPQTDTSQHVREDSADSGLSMGGSFRFPSIPEDLPDLEEDLESMDTDLETTLTNPDTPSSTTTLVEHKIQPQQPHQQLQQQQQQIGCTMQTGQSELVQDIQELFSTQNQLVHPAEENLTWV